MNGCWKSLKKCLHLRRESNHSCYPQIQIYLQFICVVAGIQMKHFPYQLPLPLAIYVKLWAATIFKRKCKALMVKNIINVYFLNMNKAGDTVQITRTLNHTLAIYIFYFKMNIRSHQLITGAHAVTSFTIAQDTILPHKDVIWPPVDESSQGINKPVPCP